MYKLSHIRSCIRGWGCRDPPAINNFECVFHARIAYSYEKEIVSIKNQNLPLHKDVVLSSS